MGRHLLRAGCCLLVLGLLPRHHAGAESFEFHRLNRIYQAFLSELVPIDLGTVHVDLRTPAHSLTLVRHRALLQPAGDGEFTLDLEFRLSGWGRIDADVTMGKISSRLTDELAVPVQSVRLFSRVSILPTADGYAITTRVVQQEVLVQIESKLASRLFGLCRPMALVLVGLDCPALEQALTRVRVPLPAPGETYLLPYAEVDAAERARFDAYLSRNRGPS